MARDHKFLVSGNYVETNATVLAGYRRAAGRIGFWIEHPAEPGEPFDDAGAHAGRVFANSGREHQGIEAPERCRQQACRESYSIGEVVERKARPRVGTRLQLANVVADARETFQAAIAIEKVSNIPGAHLLLLDKVEHNPG